jgi:sulfur carrier protein ThiS
MKCNITITPVKGKPKVLEGVSVSDGQTVGALLESQGVKVDDKFIVMMNGAPVKLTDAVVGAVNISISEKAAGS